MASVSIIALVFLILFFAGIGTVIEGIAGLIIFRILRKKGKRFATPLIIISAVILAIGILTTLLAVGVAAAGISGGAEDGESQILIDEETYQPHSFTADGIVYELIPYTENYSGEDQTPLFTYYGEGLFGKMFKGNYYALENPHGYNMVCDDYGNIFVPQDEKRLILEFYNKARDEAIYFDYLNDSPLLDSVAKELGAFIKDARTAERTTITEREYIYDYSSYSLYFDSISPDYVLVYETLR